MKTLAFVLGGLLVAQAASALELSTPAFKQGATKDSVEGTNTCDAQGGGVTRRLTFNAAFPANTKQLV
jgi:hypothetical protein